MGSWPGRPESRCRSPPDRRPPRCPRTRTRDRATGRWTPLGRPRLMGCPGRTAEPRRSHQTQLERPGAQHHGPPDRPCGRSGHQLGPGGEPLRRMSLVQGRQCPKREGPRHAPPLLNKCSTHLAQRVGSGPAGITINAMPTWGSSMLPAVAGAGHRQCHGHRGDPSPPWWEDRLEGVSHVSLTYRASTYASCIPLPFKRASPLKLSKKKSLGTSSLATCSSRSSRWRFGSRIAHQAFVINGWPRLRSRRTAQRRPGERGLRRHGHAAGTTPGLVVRGRRQCRWPQATRNNNEEHRGQLQAIHHRIVSG